MSVRVERRLGWITVNQQRYPETVAADWLDAVKKGLCPFCGEGPFTVVAIHVARKHELNRREFRDALGIYYEESICDPTHSAAAKERSTKLYQEGRTGLSKPGVRTAALSAPKHLSEAAKKRNAEQIRRMPKSQRVENSRNAAAARLASLTPLHDRVAEMVATTNLTFTQIGEHFGINSRTVRSIADRRGVGVDGRARYHGSQKGVFTEALQRASVARLENCHDRKAEIVARYTNGESPAALAAAYGMTSKSMRQLLRAAGQYVADGRSLQQAEVFTFTCPVCGEPASKPAAQVRANRKAGWDGPFCGMTCAGKFRQAKRYGGSHQTPSPIDMGTTGA